MVVILRLQGLNADAGLEDIRGFFHGLPIPEGGVHITGGETGEAFIVFSTERAGQLALLLSGRPLRGSTVTLCKSSVAEFKHKMEVKLRKKKCAPAGSEAAPRTGAGTTLWTGLLLGVAAVVHELQSDRRAGPESPPVRAARVAESDEDAMEKSPKADRPAPAKVAKPTRPAEEQEVGSCRPGYLRLYGLPNTVTKHEVCQFLEGLNVVDIITDTLQGQDRCCLVKVASFKEAEEGLKYSRAGPRDFQIQVRLAHERMWENAVKQSGDSSCSTFPEQDGFSPESRSRRNSQMKRPCSTAAVSPKRRRSDTPSFGTEYCVMVRNLPTTITKTRIRDLFSCYDIPNSKILHLLNKQGERTSTAFVIFTQPEDYTLAMNMNGSSVGSQIIDVSSITMEKMNDLMHQNKYAEPNGTASRGSQARPVLSCVYARNFPADARKADVKNFFGKYDLGEEDVELLADENGNGIGEAVVRFGCEDRAREALGLQGERFRQEPILLACISTRQMRDILHTTR